MNAKITLNAPLAVSTDPVTGNTTEYHSIEDFATGCIDERNLKVKPESYICSKLPSYNCEECTALPYVNREQLDKIVGYAITGIAKKYDTEQTPHKEIDSQKVSFLIGEAGVFASNTNNKYMSYVLGTDNIDLFVKLAKAGESVVLHNDIDEAYQIINNGMPESVFRLIAGKSAPQHNSDLFVQLDDSFKELTKAGIKKLFLEKVNQLKQSIDQDLFEQPQAHEWEEPQPLHVASQYVEGEYPIHAFPDVIAKAIKKSAHFHNVPLAVAAQTYLGEQAYIAQRHIKAPSDKSEKGQPCSLFMLTIFPSGEGKDVCKSDASKISEKIESENMQQFRADYNSWSKKKSDERGDAPVNPMSRFKKTTTQAIIRMMADGAGNSYIWATGEGGYLFSGYSLKSDTVGESISVLNDLVDTGKGNALLRNAEDSHYFENKYFSLDIAVQDVVARPALTNSLLREQGFLARVLFAAPTPLQHREVTLEQQSIKPYDDEDLKAYWKFCEKMLTTPYFGNKLFVGDDGRVIITKCQDAERLHIQYQNHIGQEVGKGGKYEFIRAYALRTNQYVLRVAAILAYCSEVDYIDARIMQNAIDLCKYSLDEWLRYYGKAEKSDSELMLEWLKKQDSSKILKSAISTTVYPKHLRSKNNRDAALNHLIDAEHIHIEQIGKKEYVVLNPLFSKVG
ncbi:DUF3987 domain-containing protein [Acinetobacter sp. A1]|uniref:DUF3987 domain-containing protein n=1 Tax=Acinetobacter sp. A1 TaxID=401467 RepID=UPI0020905454|nr:DUF3987 domain-containing protein [Acinetobacter sp. A1]